MRRTDSFLMHRWARRQRSRAMRASWRQLRRALAFRMRGFAGRLASGLRLAA